MQAKAVKSDPDPEMGLRQSQAGVIPPGSVLTAFLFSTPSRTPHDSKHPSRGGAEGKRTRYATV
jgi:hypothetical protein